jgi:2'-5' RNA ligase
MKEIKEPLLPGLQVYEYLLVIDIPVALRDRIEACRQELTGKYHISQPQTGRANISLVRFIAMKKDEERIMQKLEMIAVDEKSFTIELKDFGGYPMHAIFIRIANQPRVLELIKKLKKARAMLKAGGEDPHFLQDPNIVLAGRIQQQQYLAAMKEYQYNKFKGNFKADSFILLKRRKDEKKYKIVKRFEFQRTAVLKGQGVLFS